MTTTKEFFEIKLSIFAGTTDRKALNKDTLKSMGFNEADIDEVKAVLNTTVLPKGVFNEPLAIKKSVQDYLADKGHNHSLLGRIFNPKDRLEIIQFLREKKDEYEKWREEFLLNYQSLKDEQLAKVIKSAEIKGYDPQVFVEAVKDKQPPRSYYERKLEFQFLDISIELNSNEYQELLEKINNDLVEKTIYELGRDASSIRDIETPRGKIRNLRKLADKLESLDFYVNCSAISNAIRTILNSSIGTELKPNADYNQREIMNINGIAKVLEENASSLIKKEVDFQQAFSEEAKRITRILVEDEQDLLEESEEEQTAHSSVSEEMVAIVEKPAAKTVAGAFNF